MQEYLKTLKIYLLDINPDMTNAWGYFFDNMHNVEIHNSDFEYFMNNHPTVEGVASPGNSFGLMDGGYDKAIIDYLGQNAQTNVLTMIKNVYYGEQPVGTCLGIPFYKYIILHSPTMRRPGKILDPTVIYFCMRSVLIKCKELGIKEIVIPAFGGCTGKIDPMEVANYMSLAYKQLSTSYPSDPSWSNILRFEDYEIEIPSRKIYLLGNFQGIKEAQKPTKTNNTNKFLSCIHKIVEKSKTPKNKKIHDMLSDKRHLLYDGLYNQDYSERLGDTKYCRHQPIDIRIENTIKN